LSGATHPAIRSSIALWIPAGKFDVGSSARAANAPHHVFALHSGCPRINGKQLLMGRELIRRHF
jgi:hypothetical protein